MIPTMHRTGTHYPSFTFTFSPESKLPNRKHVLVDSNTNCHKETTVETQSNPSNNVSSGNPEALYRDTKNGSKIVTVT